MAEWLARRRSFQLMIGGSMVLVLGLSLHLCVVS